MEGFTSSRRRNRRSARSLLAEESAAYERAGRTSRGKRRANGIPDSSLIRQEAEGDVAAGRQLRNRNSARRSRDKRLAQESSFAQAATELEEALVLERSSLSTAGTHAVKAAEAATREAFVKLEPYRRAVGSRTDTRDEELQRKAREGDDDARRILKNRESARMSRYRRIDAWNKACLRLLVAAAQAETGLMPRAAETARSVQATIDEARKCQAEFGAKASGPSTSARVKAPYAGSPARARAWTDSSSVGASTVSRGSARSVEESEKSPASRPSSALSQRSRRSDSELSGCDAPLPTQFGSSADFARGLMPRSLGTGRSGPASSLFSLPHSQQSHGVVLPSGSATRRGSLDSTMDNLSPTVHALA